MKPYADKIRQQAEELTSLRTRLQEREQYGRLCERRIVELMPDHPLPVTDDCIGLPGTGRSRAQSPDRALQQQLWETRQKLSQAQTRNADLQRQLDTTEKARSNAMRRYDAAQTQIATLEAQHKGQPSSPDNKRASKRKLSNSDQTVMTKKGISVPIYFFLWRPLQEDRRPRLHCGDDWKK